ncbi:aldose epimerase family protein [Ferruginibacter sp.]
MFVINTVNGVDFEKVVLRDENTGTVVEIVPSCGALLHVFAVQHNGSLLNVIDSYTDKEDFKQNVESKGFRSSKLTPFACRINNASYNFGGQQYTIEKFILNGSALHGLLYDAVFTVTETTANEESAKLIVEHRYKGTDKGYPFKFTCTVVFELKTGNRLSVSTTITNNSGGLIPVQDGWHPYFGFGGSINELQLEFQSKEKVEFNDALIPTGKMFPYQEFGALKKIGDAEFDNCFTLNFAECQPLCVLRDPAKKLQVEIHPGASYPYLQVYTPPHRNSIAIENLSAIPDAFNNHIGLQVLEAGAAAHFTTTYIITSL